MEKYLGWKNWETWNCKLWLDEQGLTNYFLRMWQSDKEISEESMSEMIESHFWTEYEEEVKTGFFSDVVAHAIDAVDFMEITQSIKESL